MIKIFIVGVGRSGTSLLQSMLNAHPNITFLPETQFFRKYIAQSKKKISIEQKGLDKFVKELSRNVNFQRLKIDINTFIQEYQYNNHEKLRLETFYDDLLAFYLKEKCKEIVGDKDPRNVENIDIIKKYYPESFIIHTIRDPRDVVLSKTKANWSKHRPFWLHALISNAQYRMGKKMGAQLFGNKYCQLKYEDLISMPEATLQNVCNMLSIEYSNDMLNFSKSSEELVSKQELQWKKETFGPLMKDNKQKWQQELSTLKKEIINAICSKIIVDEKYYLDNRNLLRTIFKIVPVLQVTSHLFYFLFYIKTKIRI